MEPQKTHKIYDFLKQNKIFILLALNLILGAIFTTISVIKYLSKSSDRYTYYALLVVLTITMFIIFIVIMKQYTKKLSVVKLPSRETLSNRDTFLLFILAILITSCVGVTIKILMLQSASEEETEEISKYYYVATGLVLTIIIYSSLFMIYRKNQLYGSLSKLVNTLLKKISINKLKNIKQDKPETVENNEQLLLERKE